MPQYKRTFSAKETKDNHSRVQYVAAHMYICLKYDYFLFKSRTRKEIKVVPV